MKKNKITCPNCHLPLDATVTKCPYCNKDITEEERARAHDKKVEVKEEKKSKLQQHTVFYLIGLIIGAVAFLAMLLPCESTLNQNVFFFVGHSSQFSYGGSQVVVGTNAPMIVFIFVLVALLNSAAIFWSLKKKTAEVSLFSYFTAFYFVVISVVSFLGNILMSNNSSGNLATKFGPGVGFYVIGVFALAAAAFNIFGVIKYKRFLVESPKESFKLEK